MYKQSLAELQGGAAAFTEEMRACAPIPTSEVCEQLPADRGPLPANDDTREAAGALISVSKKSKSRGRRPRRSQARDRRNLVVLEDFVPDVRPALGKGIPAPLVEDPLSPSRSPTHAPKSPRTTHSKSTIKRHAANENDTRRPPTWRYAGDILRGHLYARAVSLQGTALAFSLNLGGTVLKAANDDATRFQRQFQDRLSKALRAEFGMSRDFFFAIETAAGRPHLHGAVDALVDEQARVEAVLSRCGGGWDHTRHADKQAHTEILWGPDGWLRYCEKQSALTKRQLGLKSVLSVTRGCRSRAEQLWEASRAKFR